MLKRPVKNFYNTKNKQMKHIFTILIFLCLLPVNSQNFNSYFTGETENIDTNPTFGICLMGGASEDDQAMQWFLNKADGGDVVVIRTSGSDGYNDYFYTDLGIDINSVETLVIHNENGATDPYVINAIENAEAIWFAGGNQATYVNFFRANAMNEALNNHINVKQAPIGGTSAGMAIMGEFYFDAINGSVTSDQALNNPYGSSVSIGQGEFLTNPFLQNTITDTHYNNPDRKGRHSVFISRIVEETQDIAYGIAADEFVGICIDENGEAIVFGEYPDFDDYAYFIQANCEDDLLPEILEENQALTWNKGNKALKVYQLPATSTGNNSFDVNTWEDGNGGDWQAWWVEEGEFLNEMTNDFECETFSAQAFEANSIHIYPNPTANFLEIQSDISIDEIQLFTLGGKAIQLTNKENNRLDLSGMPNGIYLLELRLREKTVTKKIIKK